MNIKRAVGIIFILYIVNHVINIIVPKLLGIGLEILNPANMPLAMWCYSLITVLIISILGTIWYFNTPKIIASIKNGFLFELTIIIFGFIVSTIILLRSRGRIRHFT